MAEKKVIDNVKEMLSKKKIKSALNEVGGRFKASPEAKQVMSQNSSGKKLKDIASGKRVHNLNRYLRGKHRGKNQFDGLIDNNKNHTLDNFIADVRKTRNNELAKTIGVWAVPATAAIGTYAGAKAVYNKIHNKRKDENNMEKISAEQYTEFIDKLAEEIIDGEYSVEKTASEEEVIANRAYAAYEAAQMQKQAAEEEYKQACAYEDAALAVMNELEDEDDEYDEDEDEEYED